MHGILPPEIAWRTDKMGYDTPTGRLIYENRDIFAPLLQRHYDDPVLNCRSIEKAYEAGGLNENVLCSAVSYLAWKEAYGVQ
jgi:hypothetical protein